jgi:hypothetical protein
MLIRHRFTDEVLFNGTVNYLRGTYLRHADLRDANIKGAVLRDANLSDAVLWDADLSNAVLWDADLSNANLMDADLRCADLMGANLWGTDLRGVNLRDAIGKVYQITGLCWQVIFTENQIQIGCEIHPVEEWRTFSNERIAKMGDEALEFWQEYKQYILDQYDFVEKHVWGQNEKK